MTHKEQNKILDDKIKANKRQYDLDRKNAEYQHILVVIYLNMNI